MLSSVVIAVRSELRRIFRLLIRKKEAIMAEDDVMSV